jgi:hypothetical protein
LAVREPVVFSVTNYNKNNKLFNSIGAALVRASAGHGTLPRGGGIASAVAGIVNSGDMTIRAHAPAPWTHRGHHRNSRPRASTASAKRRKAVKSATIRIDGGRRQICPG